MKTNINIYSKRISNNALVLAHYNGTLVRVLLNAGKRVEFSDWKSAKAKAWHIQQAGVMGFEWSRYMTRKEFDARIAQLREEPKQLENNSDDDDRAERNMLARQYYRNMANEIANEYIDNSEEDQDTDFDDGDYDDSGDDDRGW